MKRALYLAALACGSLAWPANSAAAQGSCSSPAASAPPPTYSGPSDSTGSSRSSSPSGSAPAPSTPAPAAAPPGFSGRPATPPGGRDTNPLGLNSPYTLHGERVGDATAWQLWWAFNKDPYLRYGGINTTATRTDGEDFFLGKGERNARIGGRAPEEVVQGKIVPALKKAIEGGGSVPFVQGAMLAVAKISGPKNRLAFDHILEWFLKNGGEQVNHTAAVALGVLADEGNVDLLASIARDEEAGRAATGREAIDAPMRAFAAYGLGLVGNAAKGAPRRAAVVRTLIDVLEDEKAGSDVRAAAMIAIGLVPLELEPEANVCICGTCDVAGPETSLQNQITYLLRYFTADRVYDPVVRAHTATTVARLIESRAADLQGIKEGVTDFLIGALEKSAKQPAVVRQSAVLALGLIGDADTDTVDSWIRWALNRAAGHGDPLEKRYALVSMAQVGSRPGQGEHAWAGTGVVRKDLLHHLSRGKKLVKPWAGLALGIMGHELARHGQERSPAPDHALRQVMRTARRAGDLGAYALAAGLRGDVASAELLLQKIDKVREDDARSYVALALGLMGAKEAVEPLQAALAGSDEAPLLEHRAGIALGLLGDATVVEYLLDTLEKTEHEATRAAATSALGFIGDERSIDKLVELMTDGEVGEATRERAVIALGFASDASVLSWRAALARNANYRAQTPTLTSTKGEGVLDIE